MVTIALCLLGAWTGHYNAARVRRRDDFPGADFMAKLKRTSAGYRLMSNCPILIGGGYHEAMHASGLGLLLKRTARTSSVNCSCIMVTKYRRHRGTNGRILKHRKMHGRTDRRSGGRITKHRETGERSDGRASEKHPGPRRTV